MKRILRMAQVNRIDADSGNSIIAEALTIFVILLVLLNSIMASCLTPLLMMPRKTG